MVLLFDGAMSCSKDTMNDVAKDEGGEGGSRPGYRIADSREGGKAILCEQGVSFQEGG